MDGARHVNGSSWAILPAARGRALWMARHALDEPDTVYSALTPIPTVSKLLQHVAFRAVTHQHILAATPRLALAAARSQRGRSHPVLAGRPALHALRDHPLVGALQDHVRLGCDVLALRHPESVASAARVAADAEACPWVPLVFRRHKRLGRAPAAELIYAPSQQQVAHHSDVLGAALFKRGYLLMGFDAHEDLQPEISCIRLFQRRYGRGPAAQHGIDYLYSELVYLHR